MQQLPLGCKTDKVVASQHPGLSGGGSLAPCLQPRTESREGGNLNVVTA